MNNLKIIDNNVEEFIPIYETDTGEKVVNGRELHEGLGVQRDFTDWIKQQLNSVDATEKDYFCFPFKREGNNATLYEYILKLEIAKEICLVAGASPRANKYLKDKSKDYRRYLIQFEERYKQVPQLTKKQELQLKVINGNEGERLIALGEYTDYIEDQARKPLEEKLNFIIKNATTIDEFQRIMCCFVNAIAKKTNSNSQTVYSNLYDFLKKKEGIDLYARCRNAKNKAQQERIAQGKKPYSEVTLQNKFSVKSTIKESEYEKILFIIKAKAIEEGLTIEELNKSIKFYIDEIA